MEYEDEAKDLYKKLQAEKAFTEETIREFLEDFATDVADQCHDYY